MKVICLLYNIYQAVCPRHVFTINININTFSAINNVGCVYTDGPLTVPDASGNNFIQNCGAFLVEAFFLRAKHCVGEWPNK